MNNQNKIKHALFLCSKDNAVKVTKDTVPERIQERDHPLWKSIKKEYEDKIKHLRETAVRVDNEAYITEVFIKNHIIQWGDKFKPDTFFPLPDGYTVEFKTECFEAGYCKTINMVTGSCVRCETVTIKPVESKEEVEQDDGWIGVEDSEKPKGGIPLLVAINEVVKEAYYNASFRSFHIKSTLPEEQGDREVYPTDWQYMPKPPKPKK